MPGHLREPGGRRPRSSGAPSQPLGRLPPTDEAHQRLANHEKGIQPLNGTTQGYSQEYYPEALPIVAKRGATAPPAAYAHGIAKEDNTIGVDKVSVTRFDRGGAKKTTAAINLAVGLSLQGQRTITPDMDPQRSEFVTPSGFDTYIIDAPPSISISPLDEDDRPR